MSQAEAGKGSSPRPFSISEEEYAQKWERIFGRKDVEKIVDDAKKYLKENDKSIKPVAKVIDWGIEGPRLKGLTEDWPEVGTLLYSSPPKHKFKGLTEEDYSTINQSCLTKLEAAALSEVILKEKNT